MHSIASSIHIYTHAHTKVNRMENNNLLTELISTVNWSGEQRKHFVLRSRRVRRRFRIWDREWAWEALFLAKLWFAFAIFFFFFWLLSNWQLVNSTSCFCSQLSWLLLWIAAFSSLSRIYNLPFFLLNFFRGTPFLKCIFCPLLPNLSLQNWFYFLLHGHIP